MILAWTLKPALPYFEEFSFKNPGEKPLDCTQFHLSSEVKTGTLVAFHKLNYLKTLSIR